MYLKEIRAQGFKSFADKLDLEINPGITCIVGPNGSGKSNIVDAIRWVLGEQSVKSLRGTNNMSDCIFSGSASREPMKRAMVSLTFDNTDHYLKSDFTEVEVKRIVYSTGESEYYINNSRVRLKDIQDLFLDTGIGNNTFSIISQGNVADIVNYKATDRRVVFESAAGVLKYKKRKEESLKKLDKTEENLKSIKLVIDELSQTVEPLKEQSIIAKKYLDIKSNLEGIDIALISSEITNTNEEYSKLKLTIDNLKDKLSKISNNTVNSKIDKIKLDILSVDDKLNQKREELLKLTGDLSNLNSEKKLTIERNKYEVNKDILDDNLLKLKEQELTLSKNIEINKGEVESIEESVSAERAKLEQIKNKELVLKVKKSTISANLQEATKNEYILKNRIEILENNIMGSLNTPTAVRSILNNPRLDGIHNTIGKLLDIPDEYMVATDIALGASTNYIVVDDEYSATNAIDYLKQNKLGRATFYPINIIKSRTIPSDVINDIKNINGYIGILSDLLEYDIKYKSIIENQLGNVIVVKNSNVLNVIGKLINYKYRIVSLDGEILHAGGSITGGTSKLNNTLNEKNELNKLKTELEKVEINIDSLNNDLEDIDKEILDNEEKSNVINKYIVLYNEELFNKRTTLSRTIDEHNTVLSELEGINDLKSNSLDKHLVELIENINNLEKNKEILEADIKKLSSKRSNLQDEVNDLERQVKEENSVYNKYNNELKDSEIKASKLEVKLDNLLDTLNNEYNMTYEYASVNYSLDMDIDIAKEKVTSLKKELNSLGTVNIGSISEFDRLSKRYDFLVSQKCDLESSSDELKTIISDMDEIMKMKFGETFEKIKIEFSRIFKLMFKGGKGELVLTDPDDLLNTGVEIIAIPPGKKINSPASLSGGEKALTAICLLFASLEVKPSPFVILDEAEAALDEVNVDMFGKYLEVEKDKSQFIVITHKKRMMEYADVLYGITMQESGVSKIVSAKLE